MEPVDEASIRRNDWQTPEIFKINILKLILFSQNIYHIVAVYADDEFSSLTRNKNKVEI